LPVPGMLVAAGIACGAGHGSLFPVLNGLAVARTPARLHGVVVSLYTAALDAGAVLGTPLCGAIARAAGYRLMFALMAAASAAGLAAPARGRLDAPRARLPRGAGREREAAWPGAGQKTPPGAAPGGGGAAVPPGPPPAAGPGAGRPYGPPRGGPRGGGGGVPA